MENDISGRTALITGGGTGVGRTVALALAERSVDVAVNYSRSREDAEKTAADIEKLGVRSLAVKADVSQQDEVVEMVDKVAATFGRLDMLVQSAGYTKYVPHRNLDDLTADVWDRTLGVNLLGNFFCSREAIRQMLRNDWGSIVSIVGTAGVTGLGSSVAYCASKAGILSVTRSLALAFAPEITVNAVSPGWIQDTRWSDGLEDVIEDARNATPMKRLATTHDIAEAVLFLLGGSHLVTGQNIIVDGGRVVHH